MTATQDEYDNNYEEVLRTDYESVPAKEILDFSTSWDLPDRYALVVRSYRKDKVEEKVFTHIKSANLYIKRQVKAGHECIVYDNERMSFS